MKYSDQYSNIASTVTGIFAVSQFANICFNCPRNFYLPVPDLRPGVQMGRVHVLSVALLDPNRIHISRIGLGTHGGPTEICRGLSRVFRCFLSRALSLYLATWSSTRDVVNQVSISKL